jgi:hypothetical protein
MDQVAGTFLPAAVGGQALGGGILPQIVRDRVGGGGQAAEPGSLFVAFTGPASQLDLLILCNLGMLALSGGWRE